MKKKKHNFYMLLLLAGGLLAGTALSAVGTAYARSTCVTGWQIQLQQSQDDEVTLSSRVMDDNDTVVKLQDMYVDDVRTITIDMEVEGGTANGTLYCTPSNELLYATCLETIDDEARQDFTILLTPTQEAELLTEPRDVSVYVEWSSSLNTTLQMTLLPVLSQPDEGTAMESPEDPEEEELVPAEGFLAGMADFDPQEFLALELTVPEQCDRILLSRDYEPFPPFTRYSLDGENFILLYDGGTIDLEVGEQEKIQLLLDFRDVNLGGEPVVITADACKGDQVRGTEFLSCAPTAKVPQIDGFHAPIVLTAQTDWSMEMPEGLADTQVLYYMRRFDGSEENLAYLFRDENTLTISATNGEDLAQAGTYLLDITWDYQGMTVATRQITFYINYSAYVQPSSDAAMQPTGGNEP